MLGSTLARGIIKGMEDDGLPKRWPPYILIATALIIAVLLMVPSATVSYSKAEYLTAEASTGFVVQDEPMSLHPLMSDEFRADPIEVTETIPVYDAETERLLYAIGMCESGGRQFYPDGTIVKNPNSSATGKYQLMASIWRPVAESMGINIDTEAGNKEMAYYILKEAQGLQAWEASRECLIKYNVFI